MSPSRAHGRVVHYCPQFGHSPLFQLLPKRSPRPRLDVSYKSPGDGSEIRFRAANALGVPEQTLLLVLLELAKEQFALAAGAMVIGSSSTKEIDQKLWTKLTRDCQGASSETLRITTTWYELNKRCGVETGGSARTMREQQLERLCEVVVWEMAADVACTKRQSFLVVWLLGDDNRLHLALNARLASSLMGGSYAQVSLEERLALRRDITKALHTFLSTAVAPGNYLKIGVDTLVARFWPAGAKAVAAGTCRSRRFEIRGALEAVGQLAAWSIDWEGKAMVCVRRDSKSVRNMPLNNANKTTSYRKRAFAKIPSKNNNLENFDVSGLFFNREEAPE